MPSKHNTSVRGLRATSLGEAPAAGAELEGSVGIAGVGGVGGVSLNGGQSFLYIGYVGYGKAWPLNRIP